MKQPEIDHLLAEMSHAYRCGADPAEYYAFKAAHNRRVRFEAPLGEWISTLAGFAAVLRWRGTLPEPEPITGSERFTAQGIEGKIGISMPLHDALLYAAQCETYRYRIVG